MLLMETLTSLNNIMRERLLTSPFEQEAKKEYLADVIKREKKTNAIREKLELKHDAAVKGKDVEVSYVFLSISPNSINTYRLRVVPHFPPGISRVSKTRARVKITPRFFSRGVIFTRARASLALLSLKKNGGLLVVYNT